MGKKEKTPIVINEVEYMLEDMAPEDKVMVNHCADIENKMQRMQFNMEQLAGGKEYWIAKLTQSLSAKSEKEVEAS
jgi:hypothetical protein|tara:strand:+ start:144 stop:371 length:228 start_codon:yes stop_codon:yes gene_type:complete